MKSSRRYLLIVNPVGGNGRTLKMLPQIEYYLRQRNIRYEFHFTQEPLHATDLVRDLAGDFDVVVSVGGDGTINEIINGLPDFNLPFGMIPIGTGNDFARSCLVPHDNIESAIEILLRHDVKQIDTGEVNGYRFINAFGVGFEGRTNDIGRKLMFIKGASRYILAIGYVFCTYRKIPMKVSFDEHEFFTDTFLVSVGNGWNVGGGMQLTPKAKLDDGVFDICYIPHIARWRIVTNFHRLKNGTITTLDEIQTFQTDSLRIESSEPIPVHLDGEQLRGDRTHLDIRIHPTSQAVIGDWSADERFTTPED